MDIQLGDVPSVLIGFHPWSSSIHRVHLLAQGFCQVGKTGLVATKNPALVLLIHSGSELIISRTLNQKLIKQC